MVILQAQWCTCHASAAQTAWWEFSSKSASSDKWGKKKIERENRSKKHGISLLSEWCSWEDNRMVAGLWGRFPSPDRDHSTLGHLPLTCLLVAQFLIANQQQSWELREGGQLPLTRFPGPLASQLCWWLAQPVSIGQGTPHQSKPTGRAAAKGSPWQCRPGPVQAALLQVHSSTAKTQISHSKA